MEQYPRMLVISYNGFLSSNSNGRTLLNLLHSWPVDKIAQIYMSNDYPDYEGCKQYYRITDIDAFNAFIGRKSIGSIVSTKHNKEETVDNSLYLKAKKSKTSRFIKFARRIVWNSGRWKSKALKEWVKTYNPEVILLFSGNNSFIDRYAWSISDEYKIPIVLYNCEDYYLKPLRDKHILTYFNRKEFNRTFEETMRRTIGVVYNSPKLMKSYADIFKNQNGIVLYNPADDYFFNVSKPNEKSGIAYLGNIAIGREKTLCEIADTLGELGYKLEVYGLIPDENAKKQIVQNNNIHYHGVISYNECCSVMINSLVLIHAESFTINTELHLKHVFSTKIADSLASGTCLFVYAPKDIALTEYLENNEAAVVATSHDEMVEKIGVTLNDRKFRNRIIENAQNIASINHNKANTSEVFYDFILSVLAEG